MNPLLPTCIISKSFATKSTDELVLTSVPFVVQFKVTAIRTEKKLSATFVWTKVRFLKMLCHDVPLHFEFPHVSEITLCALE